MNFFSNESGSVAGGDKCPLFGGLKAGGLFQLTKAQPELTSKLHFPHIYYPFWYLDPDLVSTELAVKGNLDQVDELVNCKKNSIFFNKK